MDLKLSERVSNYLRHAEKTGELRKHQEREAGVF